MGIKPRPNWFFLAAEDFGGDPARFVIPIEVVEGFFFLLIALAMVGPGQELGRALTRLPNRVAAYTINISGSVAGIVMFFLCSWLQLSPGWWFLLVVFGLSYFLFGGPFGLRHVIRGGLLAMIVVLAMGTALITTEDRQEFWSPYYRVDYYPTTKNIWVNLLGHQQMNSRADFQPAYQLTHLLNRDSGGQPFKKVLIIGAGSGNDVSRCLQWNAEHIDAVEIDPVIRALGKRYHPDDPYDDVSRVTAHQNDGRNFLRSTDQKYDLIIYAFVDSLVLHSSYSNIRLESYLFTKEAFEDVKRRLNPDGIFVVQNFFRQGWIVARLQKTLNEVFEAEPLVFTFPYRETVDPNEKWEGITYFIAGSARALERFRTAFHATDPTKPPEVIYWMSMSSIPGPGSPNGFEQGPLSRDEFNRWMPIGLARVNEPPGLAVATDDWPFLYLHEPMIPDLSLRGAAIMAALALLLLAWFVPLRPPGHLENLAQEARSVIRFWTQRRSGPDDGRSFDGRMFFLGAGFMIIETKAVVHMALLFGSTWMVNSFVFLAVLLMILFANLFVLIVRPQWLWPFYVALLLALVLNIVVPLNSFLGWPPSLQIAGSCLLVFAPIFFAAVIFAVSFSRTQEADRAFGFNIAGAMLGGLTEYSSMLLGFRYLLLVALAFYALSAIWRNGVKRTIGLQEM